MSKEEQARVRDELLQALYRSVLRCTLARAGAGAPARDAALDALAAGISAVLAPEDLLLLPARGAGGFRVLRGLGYKAAAAGRQRDAGRQRELDAGVLTLPDGEGAAACLALGAAAAAARGERRTLVAVLLASPVSLDGGACGSPAPAGWSEAAACAARWGLPLLLLSSQAAVRRSDGAGGKPAHLRPAPPYPSIPVDREDPLAVYRVAYECAVRARARGGGPSCIEAVNFRFRGLPAAETGALARLETALRKRGAFAKAWRRRLEHTLVEELTS